MCWNDWRQSRSCPALWLSHQSRDAYWKQGSVIEDYSAEIKPRSWRVGGGAISTKTLLPSWVEALPDAKRDRRPWVA